MSRVLLATFYYQEDSGVAKRLSTKFIIQLFKYHPVKIWYFSLKKFLYNFLKRKVLRSAKFCFQNMFAKHIMRIFKGFIEWASMREKTISHNCVTYHSKPWYQSQIERKITEIKAR